MPSLYAYFPAEGNIQLFPEKYFLPVPQARPAAPGPDRAGKERGAFAAGP